MYAVCKICVEVTVSSTHTMEFFTEKKKFAHAPSSEYVHPKIDDVQRTMYSSRFALFLVNNILFGKKGFAPYSSSSRIVYSRLKVHGIVRKIDKNVWIYRDVFMNAERLNYCTGNPKKC